MARQVSKQVAVIYGSKTYTFNKLGCTPYDCYVGQCGGQRCSYKCESVYIKLPDTSRISKVEVLADKTKFDGTLYSLGEEGITIYSSQSISCTTTNNGCHCDGRHSFPYAVTITWQ